MEIRFYAALGLAAFTALASAQPRGERQAELQHISTLVFHIRAVQGTRVAQYTCGYAEIGCVPTD